MEELNNRKTSCESYRSERITSKVDGGEEVRAMVGGKVHKAVGDPHKVIGKTL